MLSCVVFASNRPILSHSMNLGIKSYCLWILAGFVVLGSSPGDTILSANFHWSNDPDAKVNEAPGDGFAGVLHSDGWVDISENTVLLGGPVALRSGDAPPTVSISGAALDLEDKPNAPPAGSGDNEQLMYRGIRSGNSGNSLTLAFEDLDGPFASKGFDVLVYLVNTENAKYEGTYSLNVDSQVVYGRIASSFSDPGDTGAGFDNGGQSTTLAGAGTVNYLRINRVSAGDTHNLTLTNETGERAIVHGIQLLAIPEPSSIFLLVSGLGTVLLLFRSV